MKNQNVFQDGKVMAVHGPVVDVEFEREDLLPSIYEILKTSTYDEQEVVLEVIEHRLGNIARCISLTPTYGLKRTMPVSRTGRSLSVPRGETILGRVINVMGEAIDKKGDILSKELYQVRQAASEDKVNLGLKDKDGY